MVTITKLNKINKGKSVADVACLSTDTKPTTAIANGSLCLEIDTGDIYAFNEANTTWVKIA